MADGGLTVKLYASFQIEFVVLDRRRVGRR
jgi:hypothetical protein